MAVSGEQVCVLVASKLYVFLHLSAFMSRCIKPCKVHYDVHISLKVASVIYDVVYAPQNSLARGEILLIT